MKKILPVLLILMMLLQTVSCSKKPADNSRTSDMEARKAENAQMTTESTGKANSRMSLPGYTPTGNPDVDEANYAKAKEDFYNNNPEGYKAWAESMQNTANQNSQQPATPQVTTISYEDYMNLPQARKDYVDAHPELFKVVK